MDNRKIEPRTLKGFRDFLPHDTKRRKYIKKSLSKVFELYGFEPLETPAIEYEDILLGKYGEEGDKLMYRFEDAGLRKVALRYDQTVPLARVIAQYQNDLPFPFKRSQIQNVWRADNTQKGRFREFTQCDIDIVGSTYNSSDAEILTVINSSLTGLGFANYRILVNDSKIFEGIDNRAVTIIDKVKKIGEERVRDELRQNGLDEGILDRLKGTQATDYIKQIIEIAVRMGVAPERLVFDPTLARGLNYYTGIIIEAELEGYTAGSIGGGGRYDNLIGMFAGREIPAVGFAFGFDRIFDALEELNLFPRFLITTKALVTIPSPDKVNLSTEISLKLRSAKIKTELWLDEPDKLDKQIRYADKKKIPYVVIPVDENTVELSHKSPTGEIERKTVQIQNLSNEII